MDDSTIDLNECLCGSPTFIKQLSQHESVINDLEERMHQIIRQCKQFTETGHAFVDSGRKITDSLFSLASEVTANATLKTCLSNMKATINEIHEAQLTLVNTVQDLVSNSIKTFVYSEVKQIRNSSKTYQRALLDYDKAYSKSCSVSRHNMSGVMAMQKQFDVCRTSLTEASLDYSIQLNHFNVAKCIGITGRVLDVANGYCTFVSNCSGSLGKVSDSKKKSANEVFLMTTAAAEQSKQLAEERKRLMKANEHVASARSSIKNDLERPINDTPVMQGYLLKRTKSALKLWGNRFFFIKNNQLAYSHRSGGEMTVVAEDLRLCTVKPVMDSDRRFVFDVVTPSRSCTLQAESREFYDAWMDAIQDSIAAALKDSQQCTTEECRDMSEDDGMEKRSQRRVLLEVPGNELCADCGATEPTWMSINLGVILCIDCSGIHRSLGVQISKVRSLTLDDLEPECVSLILALGNARVNALYAVRVPSDWTPITPHATKEERRRWIMAKYIKRTFVLHRGDENGLVARRYSMPVLRQRSAALRRKLPAIAAAGVNRTESTTSGSTDTTGTEQQNECPKSASFTTEADTLSELGTPPRKERGTLTGSRSPHRKKSESWRVSVRSSLWLDSTDEHQCNTGSNSALNKAGVTPQDRDEVSGQNSTEQACAGDESSPNAVICAKAMAGDVPGMMGAILSGALLNCIDDDHLTVLHLAVMSQSVDAVEFAIQNGAWLDTTDPKGRTALSLAAGEGCSAIVCLLLKRGARIDVADNAGQTPEQIALEVPHVDVVTLLRIARLDLSNKASGDDILGGAAGNVSHVFKDFSMLAAKQPELLNRRANGVHVVESSSSDTNVRRSSDC